MNDELASMIRAQFELSRLLYTDIDLIGSDLDGKEVRQRQSVILALSNSIADYKHTATIEHKD